jgi:hypothetical protein
VTITNLSTYDLYTALHTIEHYLAYGSVTTYGSMSTGQQLLYRARDNPYELWTYCIIVFVSGHLQAAALPSHLVANVESYKGKTQHRETGLTSNLPVKQRNCSSSLREPAIRKSSASTAIRSCVCNWLASTFSHCLGVTSSLLAQWQQLLCLVKCPRPGSHGSQG